MTGVIKRLYTPRQPRGRIYGIDSLRWFEADIAPISPLGEKGEKDLAALIARGRDKKSPFHAQAKAAAWLLVIHNLKWGVCIAKDYARPAGFSVFELTSAMVDGLLRAAWSFCPSKGRFTTISKFHVIRAITDWYDQYGWNNTVSITGGKHCRIIKRHLLDNGQRVKTQQLADTLGMTLDYIPTMLRAYELATAVSLDTAIVVRPNGERVLLQDALTWQPDVTSQKALSATASQQQTEAIQAMLSILDERSRFVVERYFGLWESQPLDMAEIAHQISRTRERVRQLLHSALSDMRQWAYQQLQQADTDA